MSKQRKRMNDQQLSRWLERDPVYMVNLRALMRQGVSIARFAAVRAWLFRSSMRRWRDYQAGVCNATRQQLEACLDKPNGQHSQHSYGISP